MTGQRGDYFFLVSQEGGYSEIELEEIKDFNWESFSPANIQKFMSLENDFFKVDEVENTLCLIRGNDKFAYSLRSQLLST